MFKSFAEIEAHIVSKKITKILVLAGSQDPDALDSVIYARRKGVISAILIGDIKKTREILLQHGEKAEDYILIDKKDGNEAANIACDMVRKNEADIPMKGLIATSTFMHAILDKSRGFVPENGLLSQATLLEYTEKNRMMVISDCAINISPDFVKKMEILKNAIKLAHQIGIECPNAAVIAPVEVVNPDMQATVDASMIKEAAQRTIDDCIVDGPLALDNAVDIEAAKRKGISSAVAGQADILIMPDLSAGNIFTKSLHYFAHMRSAGTVCGALIPIVMTSRTDSAEDKYFAILTAILQSFHK